MNDAYDARATSRAELPKPYPFSALIGQEPLQQALLLAAIDPGIGGVLVSGPRGTAKSTAARALAELLAEGRFVTLPLGASEERLVGTLDLDEVLRGGTVRFSPGLLAQAHEGVLYVDEVNLLTDALVDALLDAAASGVNVVERDGVSHRHEARFVLIGTMNPEEGELRPQLLDRFGMMVELANCFDPLVRQRIVKARLAFDADPDAFRAACASEQQALAKRIERARAALSSLAFGDDVHARVSTHCIEAAVDGLRADLVMLRAARALAAFEGAESITTAHVDRVAEAVLRHRRREQPEAPAQEPAPSRASDDRAASADRERKEERRPGERDSGRTGASGAGQDGTGDDWGYLPPEPVGIAAVKNVVPFDAKKR
ncbi:ATP-binding protein [Trinickia caryophylli]|uniref:Protoporphyrin IX magnesium-chelatase n=1 Tax=Trinickia caryophylli TaxID=28094 RepID=A0A1X7GIC6_TRICW|nr:ATP-binding protein [Trinickia caryophylli]PMS09872.1 magnesium chelatase [Trinickia caryophylli]TRX14907.1 AAA family ATPase [Trinickia caryophylli]WQE14757.1 ATP-binding protein [Trinickia caryophylli]SMF70220.1 protoporphyrin IX magnesium-chelatase [Trinickia caryophylli]GLU34956.1 magnesium chelatase [Trinickia caryophylli]